LQSSCRYLGRRSPRTVGPELEDFAERHGIQSSAELTDLMGGSP
jgi:hypothetical protein